MYAAFLERTRKSIDALRRHLVTSDALRSAIHEKSVSCKAEGACVISPLLSPTTAPDRLEWRIIDHCAAVTRIYAIYEQFAQEMVREHLELLQTHVKFSALPEELKSAYRRGLATILEKKEGPRYGHLNLSDLVRQYSLALAEQSYTLEPLALLIQEQNLRIPELSRMLSACGINEIGSWIEKHRFVRDFFAKGNRIAASAEHEMRELIEYRNEAAHGSIDVDNLLGLDYLNEFCDFVEVICQAIAERVQLVGLECLVGGGFASHRGKVAECLKGGVVLIGELVGEFSIGDTIYLCGEDYCIAREVQSLQLANVSHQHVSLSQPTEIGLGIDQPGRRYSNIYMLQAAARTDLTPSSSVSPDVKLEAPIGEAE